MKYCLANYCFTGYEITILIILEIIFWTGLGFFGAKKLKRKFKKLSKIKK